MKPNPFSVPSSVRKLFFDFFNRPDTTDSLGITPSGARWDAVRGFFRVSNNRAIPFSSSETYPLASINFPHEDVTIELQDIDNGSGAAIWVSDGGDWWATVVDQTEVDCNCDTDIRCDRYNSRNITGYNTFESGGRNAYTYQSGTFCSGGNVSQQGFYFDYVDGGYCRRYIYVGGSQGVRCVEWNRFVFVSGYNATNYNRRTCNANFATAYNAPNFSNAIAGWNAQTCAQYTEFTINCSVCFPQWIRFIQSVGTTISTVVSFAISKTFRTVTSQYGNLQLFVQDDPNDPTVSSMRVSVEGEQITVEPFEGSDLTNKIELDEEIVYTPTGATVEGSYGIIVSPSEYNENPGFGSIVINRLQ